MVREITATALARLLESRSILALIHVREHDEYNLAHHWRRCDAGRVQIQAAEQGRRPPLMRASP